MIFRIRLKILDLMSPQTEVVADFLLGGLPEGDVAKLDELLGKLIARLEARDDQGRSLFIESTKPADEEGT